MSSGTGTAYVIVNGTNFADSRLKGLGDSCYLFGDATANGHHFATTAAFTSTPDNIFHCDRYSLQLVTVNDGGQTLTGSWKVEVSNDYTPASTGTNYGQVAGNAGKWSDITSAFSPAIAAVTDNSSQFAQMDIRARAIRVTFTPTP